MRIPRRMRVSLTVVAILMIIASPAAAQRVVVKIGTFASEGTPWYDVLQQMGQEWERLSEGRVKLRIFGGGVMGDELEMVTKVRIGQLQAVAVSSVGIHHIEPAVSCLQIPMMFDSYDELDYVRDRVAPRLEKMLRDRGFVVLNWGDVGWVHFFTKRPASTPDDIRAMKLWISAGDAKALELYRAAGMRPVPLALTDILPGLQTGLIDAFDVPPLLALVNQWFGLAKNMVDVKWAPLIGATIVSKSAWARVPEELRPKLMEAAREGGRRFLGDIRKMSDDAVTAMTKRGLNVTRLDDATLAIWRREAEAVYPKIRGNTVPADLFDEVRRLRDEFRALRAGGP